MRLLNTVPDHIRPVLEPLLADAELKGYARGVAEGKAAGQSELLSGLKALQYLMPGSPANVSGCHPMNLSQSVPAGAEQVTDDDDVHSLVPEQSGDSDAAAFKMLVMTAVKEAMAARGEDPQPVLDYLSDLLDDPTELRKWMRGKGDATELAWKPAKSKSGGSKAEWDGEGGVQRKPLYGQQAQAALDRQNAFGGDVDDEELAAASKDVGHSDDAKTLAKGRKAAQVHARLMALKPGQFNDGHVKDLEAVLPTLTHKQAGDLRKTLLAHFGEKATLGRTRVERLANIKSHVARLTGAAQQAVQDGMADAPTPDGVAPSQPTADQPTEAKPKSVQTPADKAQSDIRRDIGAMVGGVPRDTIVNIMRHAGLTPEQVDEHIAAVKAERTAKKGKPAGRPAPSAAPAPEPVAEPAPAPVEQPAEAASEPAPAEQEQASADGPEPTYTPGRLFDDGETDQKVAGLERAAIRAGLVPDGDTLPTGTPDERRNKLYDLLDKHYEENGELSPDLPKSLHDHYESMYQQRAEEEFARENTISDDELQQQQKSEAENQGFYVADGKYVAHPDHIEAAKKRVAQQQARVDTLEYLQTQKQSTKERDRRAKALSDATSQLAEMQSAVDAIGAASGSIEQNPPVEPALAVAPAVPATPVQPEPAPVAAPEPEPVTAEPTVTAPEPVTPPKTAPAPAADADTAKKVKAAEDAENARRRGRGLRAMSGDERKKFLDGVRAKLAASKPAPTPTEDAEKQAEADQRTKLEQAKFTPIKGAFGTNKPFPDRVQANDGKWYLPDEVTATGPADADAANPPKKDDGMRYGDDNAEVGAQQSLQDLVDGGGDVDAGDFAAISQASGVPVARVKKMHEDLVASTIEDRVREAMAGGKLSADAKAKIAATLKVSPAKVANALKRVGEQDAFIALQDMKAAGEVTADGLKKVAKDTGLTPEQVRKVLQSLDDSSQLGVPDDDAPPPPAPKKPAAKKAKTPTTPPVEPKPKAPAKAKPAVVKNALDTIKAFGGNAEGVEGHLSKLSDADRAAVAAKLGVPDGSPADMAKAITGTSAPPPDHDSSVTKAEGETRPSPTTQSAVNQPAPLPAPVPPATSSPNPLAEMTDDEMRAEFERRFGGAKTAKSSESVKDAPAPPHNVLSQGVVNEVHDLLGGKYANIRMAPIHEIREAIRQKFGDQAASRDVFNELLLDMRRQKKIRLTSISDRSRATEQQLNDSVFAVGETFFYVEKTPDTPPKSPIPTTPAADQPTPKKAEGTPTTPPVEPRPKAPAKAKPAKAPTPPEPAKPLTEMTDDELAAELARRKTASPKAAPKPKAPTELSPEHHQQRDDLKSLAEKATKDPDSVSDQEIEDAMTRLQSTKMSDADAKALALAITGVKETTKKKAILAVRGKLTAAKRILEGQKS